MVLDIRCPCCFRRHGPASIDDNGTFLSLGARYSEVAVVVSSISEALFSEVRQIDQG